ncbi:MAG: DNA translocase FtsK, partial [Chloroflexi bacterium]|nr:DNA translocase FtsK [Chloroflexota bacterium]
MAKRKASAKSKSGQPNSGGGAGFARSFFLLPFRFWYVSLTIIFVALIYWQRQELASWIGYIASNIWALFGWGLVLTVVAIATVALALWRKREFVLHHWHQWLGGLIFAFFAWGLLSFFGQGGRIGLGIIGGRDFLGALRLLGIGVVGFVLVAPRFCCQQVAQLVSWVGSQFKKKVVSHAPGKAKRSPAPVAVKAEAETQASSSPRELKQVAQEVWKKYGQSPNVVVVDGWRLPPIDILDRVPEVQFSQADNVQRAKLIEEALGSYGVEAKVVQINTGPTVTQFGVEPGWDRKTKELRERDRDGNIKVKLEEVSKTRVKVERITSLANDLALALAAPSIRIEAPVPGEPVVGIEVPNTVSGVVSLRGVIESSAFQKMQAKSKMTLALGKGAGGEAVVADLTKMPHLLIAGATGSGKTVCLNTTICSLLMNNTPYDVQFIMVDPKRVELTSFNSIPHLAVPVIVDAEKALSALRWLAQEMDNRYKKLAAVSSRNIDGYNKNRQGSEKMPYLVLVIDELADLMMAGGDEVERILCRLAQLARAVGIHLVVATQRPSVDVVTGLIKANFPTRISFAVTSQVDSRTILDIAGAEKLLGKGDMLYAPTEAAKPKRLQGC